MQEHFNERKVNSRKIKNAPAFLNLDNYIGKYLDDFYGQVQVIKNRGTLRIHFLDGMKGDLRHWHHNTFRIIWDNELYGRSFINFNLNDFGEVANLSIDKIGLFPFGEMFDKFDE